jgi:uncharacterized protein YndB with AHSA1/START domain
MTMTNAIDTSTAAIERRLDLAADPERVWRALTDSNEIVAWFSQRASVPTQIGEEGWLEFDGYGRFRIRVEALEPGRHIAWRWASKAGAPIEDESTLVEWTVEPAARGGSTLLVRESGFTRPEARSDNVAGWLSELDELVAHLADEPWQRGIRRTYALESTPARVWDAFTKPEELAVWWGGRGHLEIRPGFEGWWDWPSEGGRFAMRIEAVEPIEYLAWTWATVPETPLTEAEQVLHTEWHFEPRDDGGTNLHLLETGFRGPKDHSQNSDGWDSDVLPALRRHLGEEPPAAG